jgi:hypothetical protein
MVREEVTIADTFVSAAALAAVIAYITDMGVLFFGLLTAAGFCGGLLIVKPWHRK